MKRKAWLSLFVICGLLIVFGASPLATGAERDLEGAILYVDWEAAGANDGTSWEDAFTDLQPALEAALVGDQIWVAAGSYYPSVEVGGVGDRYKTFQLRNGVGIYGGFDPTVGDVSWDDRDWVANETVLSGDIGAPGSNADNCYHVFCHPWGTNLDNSADLDGFTITAGAADDSGSSQGGGMFNQGSSPELANCTFSSNWADYMGGGMYNESSSPVLTNCAFLGNEVSHFEGYGGGMFNQDSSPVLNGCLFEGNSAQDGGGMENRGSTLVLTKCTFSSNYAWGGGGYSGYGGGIEGGELVLSDCTFSGNYAYQLGGGLYTPYGATLTNVWFEGNWVEEGIGGGAAGGPFNLTNCTFIDNFSIYGSGGGLYSWDGATLTNCTFAGNSAYAGAAWYNDGPATATNSILWGDSPDELAGSPPSVIYSNIQGGFTGAGNIDTDPLWVDPDSGDFHLSAGSPCVDAGTDDAPGLPPTDFEGDNRIIDGDSDGSAIADMGVDEAAQPIAGLEAGSDGPTPLGSATTLTATVTAGSNVVYAWAFGDGIFDSGQVVTHIYPAALEYTAVVTATNSVSLQEATTIVLVFESIRVYAPFVCRHW